MRKLTSYLLAILVFISLLSVAGCRDNGANQSTGQPSGEELLPKQGRLRVATTTSLYDTGLWGYLEPMFEERYGVELDILYAGTGIALRYGESGDVDVITVHSKSRELDFVANGFGVERVPFAYNYFLIVGPKDDPAGIQGMTPEDAFRKLMDTGSGRFVSRGDDSGTHSKEKAIWKAAGYDDYEAVKNAGALWYLEGGSGMGSTLLKASELRAYTLSDMGTFLAYQGKLDLVPIVDQGSILLNVYSAMACTKARSPEMAANLVSFLVSPEIQELIGNYGTAQYDLQLFTPCAGAEPT